LHIDRDHPLVRYEVGLVDVPVNEPLLRIDFPGDPFTGKQDGSHVEVLTFWIYTLYRRRCPSYSRMVEETGSRMRMLGRYGERLTEGLAAFRAKSRICLNYLVSTKWAVRHRFVKRSAI
jgi:hypothetical protein